MNDTVYVQRDAAGSIVAVFDTIQPGVAEEAVPSSDISIVEFQNPLVAAEMNSVSSATLLARLTDAEYAAIVQAGAMQVAAGNGQLSRWFDMMRTMPVVGLTDAATVAARAALVAAGLLTAARADAIFAP